MACCSPRATRSARESRIELRRPRPAARSGHGPGRAGHARRPRLPGPAAAAGHRRQRQHQQPSPSPRPASSPPTTCAARTARATPPRRAGGSSYDLLAFAERGQPVSVRTDRRVHHDTDTDVPAEQRDEVIVSVEYSDGFGRVCCRPAPRPRTPCSATPRSAAGSSPPTSRTRRDDRGRTRTRGRAGQRRRSAAGRPTTTRAAWSRSTSRSSPRAGTTPQPSDAQRGQKATVFYDPRGHPIRTVNPDGSEQRVVFGSPGRPRRPRHLQPDAVGDLHLRRQRQRRPHPRRTRPRPTGTTGTPRPASRSTRSAGRRRHGRPQRPRPGRRPGTSPAPPTTSRATSSSRHRRARPAAAFSLPVRPRSSGAGGWTASTPAAATPCPTPLGDAVESRDSKGALDPRRVRRAAPADPGVGPRRRRRRRSRCGSGSSTATPATPTSTPTTAPPPGRNLLGRPSRTTTRPGWSPSTDVDFKGNVLESARQVIADAPILAVFDAGRRRRLAGDAVPGRLAARPRADPGRPSRRAARARRLPDHHQLRRPQPGHPPRAPGRRRGPPPRAASRLQPRRRAGADAARRHASTSSASPTTPRASGR